MENEIKISRDGFGIGPWDDEPDRIEWESYGLPCLMRRSDLGSWCGYVAVFPGHPAFERNYDDIDVDVHGGLTYADHCHGSICHVPKLGEPDSVWWLGFDCAHLGDIIPAFRNGYDSQFRERYRDVPYVRKQVKHLAKQLAKLTLK